MKIYLLFMTLFFIGCSTHVIFMKDEGIDWSSLPRTQYRIAAYPKLFLYDSIYYFGVEREFDFWQRIAYQKDEKFILLNGINSNLFDKLSIDTIALSETNLKWRINLDDEFQFLCDFKDSVFCDNLKVGDKLIHVDWMSEANLGYLNVHKVRFSTEFPTGQLSLIWYFSASLGFVGIRDQGQDYIRNDLIPRQ